MNICCYIFTLNLDCLLKINDRSLHPFLEARASLEPGLSVCQSLARSHFSSSTCQSNTYSHCYSQDGFDGHQDGQNSFKVGQDGLNEG